MVWGARGMFIDYSDRKELGRSGEKVSAVGLGTWNIRRPGNMVEAIVKAVELGLDMVDTAEMYGNGSAEEVVGKAIELVGRDNIFITTKVLPDRFRDEYNVFKAVEASLRRLGVVEADLILVHWPVEDIPVGRMMRIMEKAADKGYTRYIGVSNFGVGHLEEALSSLSKYDLVVNQVRYSVFDKSIEPKLLPYMIRNRITVQAYTPLERGRIVKDARLSRIGEKYGKTGVQVALNYLISHNYVTAIPKTERVERVIEYRGALGWRLDEEDLLYLKRF